MLSHRFARARFNNAIAWEVYPFDVHDRLDKTGELMTTIEAFASDTGCEMLNVILCAGDIRRPAQRGRAFPRPSGAESLVARPRPAEGLTSPEPGRLQRSVDLVRVEAGQSLLTDDDQGHRHHAHRDQLLASFRHPSDVLLRELHTLSR